MGALIGWACFICPPVVQDVQLADLKRFQGSDELNIDCLTCQQQIARCELHRGRIAYLKRMRGWENGLWDDAEDCNEQAITYWYLLSEARCGIHLDGKGRCNRLRSLRNLIGPERYHQGWRPVMLPDPDDTLPRYQPKREVTVPDNPAKD